MQHVVCSVLLICLSALALLAQDTTGVGRLVGIVIDPAGDPVVGAGVCIVDTGRCVETDEAGRFAIADLRSASYVLEFSRDETVLRSESVDVRAGINTRFEVTLPLPTVFAESVTVSAPVFVTPEEVKNSNVLILGEEVWKSAGTLQDVSRYVTTLPGVAGGSADFRNDIIVRGGSPLENLFIVGIRRPDESRIAWAHKVWAEIEDTTAQLTRPQVYARENLALADYPPTLTIPMQAFRIGSLGVSAIPNEVFAETGLAIKQDSTLKPTFTIELANGYFGYLPTAEQHGWGGYETWPARSSCLETEAETKIRAEALRLLQSVA